MNINFNISNAYVKSQEFGTFAKENEAAAQRNPDSKQDRVCISADAAAYRATNASAKAIAGEIAQTGKATKIAELRTQVQSGTYYRSDNELADAILNRTV